MRILFLSDNFPPEGNAPATRLWEHATRWVRDGHEVTVITCAPNFPEGQLFEGYQNRWRQVEVMQGIRVVRVKTYITANEGFIKRTLDYMSFMLMGVFFGVFERRPDVVVGTSPQFFCALGGWFLSVLKWRPFVFELRDLWPATILAVGAMRRNFIVRLLEKVELFLYHRSNAIISVTQSFHQDLVFRGIDERKIHVIRNGVDLSIYEPRARDRALEKEYQLMNKFVVGYIGTHGLCHNLPSVLEAAEILSSRKDIVFFFAGSGAERKHVEEIVRSRKLLNVRLIPRQSKEMMPAIWSLCDIALVPLRNDPVFRTVIPSKIFEAMAMGIPILMSLPEGEATDIVHSAQAGVCIEPESPAIMAKAVELLADDSTLVSKLRTHSLIAARKNSREELAAQMIAVLESVSHG